MRVTFGDHHSQNDVLETRQNKHAAVLHVRQIFVSGQSRIERNIPGIKTKSEDQNFTPLNPVSACLLEEMRTIPATWW